ncbi:hypothetical protein BZA70DRAFT_279193 [Myxozyma melibiosi]|uniref:Uncharacterized protein n=1 Tax=Myxozyma melibiosi TaxID=54550 RepID=A0ABR1F5P7_9ASCO
MSISPVILPFTHWPVAYNDAFDPVPEDIPTDASKSRNEHLAALAHLPSDTVLTCATVFSRGVVLGLANGAIEVLQWDNFPTHSGSEDLKDRDLKVVSLSPLSTTAGHRQSPVVAMRRITAKDTEGRSELLISAADNGEILKHSLPSGRVLASTTVPFRPNGIIPIDMYLLVYGRSTEMRLLHQGTLESHVIMDGVLENWPIPLPLFAERMVTLNASGDGIYWKIWPDEARVEQITKSGAPIGLFNHAKNHYMLNSAQIKQKKSMSLPKNMSHILGRDTIAVSLGNSEYGDIIDVLTVGDTLWLIVQTDGWCLYMWEEDRFDLVKQESFPGISGASTSDAVDDHHRNWFGIWNHEGAIVFAVVSRISGKTVCTVNNMPASKKPNHVNSLFMVFSYTTMHLRNRSMLLTPWVTEPLDVVVEFFFSEGEIRYRLGDLRTFTWEDDFYPVHRQNHFFTRQKPFKSFAPPTPMIEKTKMNFDVVSSSPGSPAKSLLTAEISNSPLENNKASGPCTSGVVFSGMLVFGCGAFVNFYSLPRYLLAFESPERTIQLPESGKVTHLSSMKTPDNVEYLLIGTNGGVLYLLDAKTWKLSPRIALSGSPVLYSMSLPAKSNLLIRGLAVIASRDGTVCLVNLKKGRRVFTIPGHFAQIRLLATPKDSNILIVLYEDYFGRVCNLRNGKIENQTEIVIENEDEWEVSHVKLRPTIPENTMLYTDARYTINGSSTVFVNVYIVLDEIRKSISSSADSLASDSPCLIVAKSILSTLYPFHIFEKVEVDGHLSSAQTEPDSMTKLVELLFLRKFSSIKSVEGEDPMAALYSVPAKLGSRGISNTLTVFHAHQNLLQTSGEITSMVYLVSVVLARALLEAQLLSDSVTAEDAEKVKIQIEIYIVRFVEVIFSVSEEIEGLQYKRPWLRGFARFWNSDHADFRLAARTCLQARIKQLIARPKELSLTISRWRVLLPGVITPKRRSSTFNALRRMSTGGGSPVEDRRMSLERVTTADAPDLAGIDEVIDDSPESMSVLSGFKGLDDDCIDAVSESSVLAVIILGNLASEFSARVTHVAHREIVTAIEFFLFKSDAASSNPREDSLKTKELQNISIELVGKGWTIWGDDQFFSSDSVIGRLIDFMGADTTPITQSKKAAATSNGDSAETDESEPTLTDADALRHDLLIETICKIAHHSINRVIEICAETIAKSPNPQSRIGAVRMIFYIAKRHPDLLVNRLFPVVDATIASLDPASTGVRNKVVNSITALFNLFVNTYPVISSHRAQQRLALSLLPDIVVVYDLRTGVQMASLEGAKNQLLEIQFSPEGRHVVGIDRVTHEVYVWKLGHSFLSMIQSIGGGGPASIGSGHYSAYYNGAVADAAGMDLVFPRFVGKLKHSHFELSDMKKENSHVSITFKQEKVIEVVVNGKPQVFDFIHT